MGAFYWRRVLVSVLRVQSRTAYNLHVRVNYVGLLMSKSHIVNTRVTSKNMCYMKQASVRPPQQKKD